MKEYGIAAVGAAALALFAWAIATGPMHLPGNAAVIFGALLGFLGIAAGCLVVWYRTKKRVAEPAAEEAGGCSEELDQGFRELEKRLAGSRIAGSSIYFVLGPPSAGKTHVVLKSGLNVDGLTGGVEPDGEVTSTAGINAWFTRGAVALGDGRVGDAIFVEAGGRLVGNESGWRAFVSRVRPGLRVWSSSRAARRAAVVCISCEELLRMGPGPATEAMARRLRDRLRELAAGLGVSLPMYVIFTKVDRVPFFEDYIRRVTKEEASARAWGSTFTASDETVAPYTQSAGNRLGSMFEDLFRAIAGEQLLHLRREDDRERRPAVYEFPREFRRLRDAVVQCLVEVSRPSQLAVSPFLRGFYFTGVRSILVSDPVSGVPGPDAVPQQPAPQWATRATSIMKTPVRGSASPGPVERVPATRKVWQWIFLEPIFADVLLKDRAGLGASGENLHIRSRQRFALIAASAALLLFGVFFTISFFLNRSLISRVRTEAAKVRLSPVPSNVVPPVTALEALETLRTTIEQLERYQTAGHPWSMNWGLFAGERVRPEAVRLYYDRFHSALFGDLRERTEQKLRTLPAKRRDSDEFGPSKERLKAYLVTTSEHQRPEGDWQQKWLGDLLYEEWVALHPEAPEKERDLARRQFVFYAARLRTDRPFIRQPDAAAVRTARLHLEDFSGLEQVYQSLRSRASVVPKIRFGDNFPTMLAVVNNPFAVDGAFTAKGWSVLQGELKKSAFGGEQWVLGRSDLPIQQPERLREDVLTLYLRDYVNQWTTYIQNTRVVRYRNASDAAVKLRQMGTANESPLLAALWLASQNTAPDDRIRKEFAPLHSIVPSSPDGARNFVSPISQNYTTVLTNLATAIDTFAANAFGQDQLAAASQTAIRRIEARSAVSSIAGSLPPAGDGRLLRALRMVLEQPIEAYEAPDPARQAAAGMDGAAKGFCAEFMPVQKKFPFTPKATEEVGREAMAALFARPNGSFWKLEAAVKPAVVFDGARYAANPQGTVKPSAQFLAALDRFSRFAREMYPENSPEPRLRFKLTWHELEQQLRLELTMDGQRASFSPQAPTKSFDWAAPANGRMQIALYAPSGGEPIRVFAFTGPWAPFKFTADANSENYVGGVAKLTWDERSGRSQYQVNVRPLTYQFSVDNPILTTRFLHEMTCVSQVASK